MDPLFFPHTLLNAVFSSVETNASVYTDDKECLWNEVRRSADKSLASPIILLAAQPKIPRQTLLE
jgi:hypothetical protein